MTLPVVHIPFDVSFALSIYSHFLMPCPKTFYLNTSPMYRQPPHHHHNVMPFIHMLYHITIHNLSTNPKTLWNKQKSDKRLFNRHWLPSKIVLSPVCRCHRNEHPCWTGVRIVIAIQVSSQRTSYTTLWSIYLHPPTIHPSQPLSHQFLLICKITKC